MDYSDQIGRIGELSKKFRASLCGADQTGVGEAIIEDLKHVVPSTEGYVFSIPVKVDMAAGLRAVMEQKRLHLVNDRKMIMQINGLRYQVTKAGNLIFQSPEKERLHDDYLWALALAVYRAREPPAVIQPLFG
jgi:hypothetical protein